ncbi:MAG: mechanosensitive ion channel family protein [Candidatus Thermoplasmatota archaeon]|nr:mechanosensitive ion channel family protein [Candidatus Thermoplasmatota archaeon]MBS3790483.1 mechanosensitive ion channel family protein [Candidatus Thermoplasmatota archaeon]
MEIAGYDLLEELPYLGFSLWNLILFLVTLVVGLIIVKMVSISLKKNLLKGDISKILAEFLTRVVRILLYIFVIGVSLSFLGINVGAALVSLSVVLGFVLGFALGDTLSNVAAGVMIAVTKPFGSGDYVEVNGEEGKIKHVGITLTEMDKPDNTHIIIPNSSVWGGNIINYTRNENRRVDIETGVSYDDDLDLAIETSMNVIESHPNVLNDPEPQVKIKSMGDSAVVLTVRPWVKAEDYWSTFFDLQKALKEAYDEAGLEMPYPQRDVHLDEE